MNINILFSQMWSYFMKSRITQMLFLLFPISIAITEYRHEIAGSGVNALLFEAFFGNFNLFSVVFPIFIIIIVSDLNASEWLSDMRTWSIIRAGYKRYLSGKIVLTLFVVCMFVIIGDLLSLIFLSITHGFIWVTDPRIIAPGLRGLFGPFLTIFTLVVIQLVQTIGYALCSLWLLQYAKRIWETIVYPFLIIVILPILLLNLMIIPESFIPSTISNSLIIDDLRLSGWKALSGNLIVWGGLVIIYGFIMMTTLRWKRRRGLIR